MNLFQIEQKNEQSFEISGALTFKSIDKAALKLCRQKLQFSQQSIVIDLQQVSNADSAGLALVIEWIKQAEQQQTRLYFQNIPQQLLALAKLSGFEHRLTTV